MCAPSSASKQPNFNAEACIGKYVYSSCCIQASVWGTNIVHNACLHQHGQAAREKCQECAFGKRDLHIGFTWSLLVCIYCNHVCISSYIQAKCARISCWCTFCNCWQAQSLTHTILMRFIGWWTAMKGKENEKGVEESVSWLTKNVKHEPFCQRIQGLHQTMTAHCAGKHWRVGCHTNMLCH